MNRLSIQNLSKTFGNGATSNTALSTVSLDLSDGEFVSILGPSGCGKTSLLKTILGSQTPDSGRIEIDGQTVFDAQRGLNVSMQDRGIGMVFQNYAIWPHMSVREHLEFALGASRLRHKRSKIADMIDLMRLQDVANQRAQTLSGGQRQRLALGRALVAQPKLVLLDEPFSNLDAHLLDGLRQDLKELQREIGATFLFVTHNQADAFTMSDRIAIMSSGQLLRVGTPASIWDDPHTKFVSEFLDVGTIVSQAEFHQAFGFDPELGDKILIPMAAIELDEEGAHLAQVMSSTHYKNISQIVLNASGIALKTSTTKRATQKAARFSILRKKLRGIRN